MKTINNISLFLALAAAALFSPATQAADPPLGQASYIYDAGNRLTQVDYSNGRKIVFTYDNNGNLTNMTGAPGIVLKNGTALTGISGSKGGNKLYPIEVTAGQSLLEVKVSGGTGECDLEVTDSLGTVKKYSLSSGNSETIRISDPAAGTWRINLVYRTDVSGLSLKATCYSGIPPAPAGLKASDGTFTDKIVLTWTESAGVASYLVYRKDIAPFTSATADLIAEVEDTTYTDDSTLDPTMPCTYFIRAKRSVNAHDTLASPYSAGDSGYITKKPLPPATVAASDGTYFNKVRVTWTASLGASSYDVFRYTNAGLTDDENAFRDITGLSCDDDNCEIGTIYYYAVKAVNSNGSSLMSKGNAGTLSKKGPATITATSGTIYNKIRVSWAAVSGAASYNIYIDGGGPINTTSTTYEDAQGPSTPHTYKVKAVNGANESDFSPTATGKAGAVPTQPLAPVLKTVSTDLYKFVRLTWGEVGLATDYRIYRSTGTVFSLAEWIGSVSVPNVSYDNLTTGLNNVVPGTKYNYWVTAYNGLSSMTSESKPSSMLSGRAAADIEGGVPLTSGTPVSSITDILGGVKYYSIVVPDGTTRLVATLTGTNNAVTNDCDLYLKLGCYPTKTSNNAKGIESVSGETAIVTNPATGTWYIMLYAVKEYSGVTLKVDCYSAADIILTQVPLNNQPVPYLANFKGRVVDEVGTGIKDLYMKVRDPIKGTITTLATKTDATGYFTYSTTVNLEGEHTYDFFFANFPDTAKGTASHTVRTKIGAAAEYSDLFDAPSYISATPVALSNLTDTTGMQTFLNIRNGWSSTGPIDSTYEDMWVNSTIIKTSTDSAITDRCTDGLFIVFYGVEGAGAGNDTTATSALSAVPLVVHITPANLPTVLTALKGMSVISAGQETDILAGGIGLVAVAVIKDPDEAAGTPSDLSLLPADQLSLISDFITNSANTVPAVPATAVYSTVTTRIFTITLNGGSRKINIVTVAY